MILNASNDVNKPVNQPKSIKPQPMQNKNPQMQVHFRPCMYTAIDWH